MPILLTDDIGRPIPQYLSTTGTVFEPVKGSQGAMTVALKGLQLKEAASATSTPIVLPVQLINSNGLLHGSDDLPISVKVTNIIKNTKQTFTNNAVYNNEHYSKAIVTLSASVTGCTLQVETVANTFVDFITITKEGTKMCYVVDTLPSKFKVVVVGSGDVYMELLKC